MNTVMYHMNRRKASIFSRHFLSFSSPSITIWIECDLSSESFFRKSSISVCKSTLPVRKSIISVCKSILSVCKSFIFVLYLLYCARTSLSPLRLILTSEEYCFRRARSLRHFSCSSHIILGRIN